MQVYQHYMLVDPRITDEIKRVRYIGRTARGLGKRLREHLNRAEYRPGGHCGNWIRQLASLGLEPILIELGDGPEEREAELIAEWRARGADLTNNTLGGDGACGAVWTPEQRARRAIVAKGVAARPGWKEKVAERTRDALAAPATRAKIAAGVNAYLDKPGAREKRTAVSRATILRPEVRAKLYRPEVQAKRVTICAAAMNTPEARARQILSLRATRADPEVARGYEERMREMTRRPEVIEKRVEAYSQTFLARRGADPDNARICDWMDDGLSKAEIARRLGWAYKKVVKRVINLRKDGRL